MASNQQSPTVEIRASACQQCESCKKRERYNIIPVTPDLPNPVIMLMAASPLAVLVNEVHSPNHVYMFFRCEDPMCLLANARQSIIEYWLADQRRKMVVLQQQVARGQRKKRSKKKHK